MKKLFILILSFSFFSTAIAKNKHRSKYSSSKTQHTTSAQSTSNELFSKNALTGLKNYTFNSSTNTIVYNLLNILQTELGKPYIRGSNGPRGFDCSGLIKFAFSFIGITLPRTAMDISHFGQNINVDDLRPGDLVFFAGRHNNRKTKYIGHVGCVYQVDSNKLFMIHASEYGVNILDLTNSKYYKERFICARRLFDVDTCTYYTSSIKNE